MAIPYVVTESFECGPGWVKCSNSYCIPVEDVCNGVRDCQHGEDEQMCGQ